METFVASFPVEIMEARESENGKVGHVKAVVSTFDHPYQMEYQGNHKMLAGAFDKSIADSGVAPTFFQHNWSFSEQAPIGVTHWSVSSAGLVADVEFFLDTDSGRAVYYANKAKALREWSIGYIIKASKKEEAENGWYTRAISEAQLLENSSVLKGANDQTRTLQVASAAGVVASPFTQDEARRIAFVETAHEMEVSVPALKAKMAQVDETPEPALPLVKLTNDELVTIAERFEIDVAFLEGLTPEAATFLKHLYDLALESDAGCDAEIAKELEDLKALADQLGLSHEDLGAAIDAALTIETEATAAGSKVGEGEVGDVSDGGDGTPSADAASSAPSLSPSFAALAKRHNIDVSHMTPVAEAQAETGSDDDSISTLTRVMKAWREVKATSEKISRIDNT